MQKQNIIIFLKIGNKYYYNYKFNDNLEEIENTKYLSFLYEESFFYRNDILYANCIFQTFNFDSIIKNHEKFSKFKIIEKKLFNQTKTLLACKLKKSDYHLFIDDKIISDYYSIKLEIYRDTLETTTLPIDYEYLKKAYIISETIYTNNILKYNNEKIFIRYNPFTAYGRYGLLPDSFNILSLKKENRVNLNLNKNFSYLEIDFNSFEIRILFMLLGIKQPQEDLYDCIRILSKSKLDRDSFKKDLIHKIYSKNEHKTPFYSFIKESKFYEKYKIENGFVQNIFGKKMDCDDFHLFSRIIQSTGAYIFYNQIYKIINFIYKNKLKSKILFCIHDSLCIAIHNDEKKYIEEIIKIYSKIELPEIDYSQTFLCKTKIGTNLGDMKEHGI